MTDDHTFRIEVEQTDDLLRSIRRDTANPLGKMTVSYGDEPITGTRANPSPAEAPLTRALRDVLEAVSGEIDEGAVVKLKGNARLAFEPEPDGPVAVTHCYSEDAAVDPEARRPDAEFCVAVPRRELVRGVIQSADDYCTFVTSVNPSLREEEPIEALRDAIAVADSGDV